MPAMSYRNDDLFMIHVYDNLLVFSWLNLYDLNLKIVSMLHINISILLLHQQARLISDYLISLSYNYTQIDWKVRAGHPSAVTLSLMAYTAHVRRLISSVTR